MYVPNIKIETKEKKWTKKKMNKKKIDENSFLPKLDAGRKER